MTNLPPSQRRKEQTLWVLSLVWLSLIGGVLVFDPYLDSLLSFMTPQPLVAGQMRSVHGDVRRKNRVDKHWSRLNTAEPLAYGDEVYSGPSSHVTLRFSSTLQSRIEANTLMAIERRASNPRLRLKYGMIQVQMATDDRLVLDFADKSYAVHCRESTQINVSSQNEGFHLEVSHGEISFGGKTVRENEKVVLQSEGEFLSIRRRQIALRSPRPRQTLWLSSEMTTTLSWAPLPKREYLVSVAKDPFFHQVLHQARVSGREALSLSLPQAGRFYWQVQNSTDLAQRSDIGSFEALAESLPILSYPPDLAHFRLSPEQSFYRTTLVFQTSSPSHRYLVQISTHESFDTKSLTLQEVVDGTYIDDLFLPEGKYFWRVKSYGEDRRHALWSAPRALVLYPHDRPLDQPRLLSAQVRRYSLPAASKTPAQISFDRVFGAEAYRFEIEDKELQKTRQHTQTSPTLLLRPERQGVHLIRAQAIHSVLLPSHWSKTAVAIFDGNSGEEKRKTEVKDRN